MLVEIITAFAFAVLCRGVHARNPHWPPDTHIDDIWMLGDELHITWSAP